MNSRIAQAIACVVLLLMLAIYPVLLFGVDRSLASMKNTPILWIPDSFPGVRVFREFVDRFDSLEVILVSWEGATVDDERLEKLTEALRARQEARSGPKSYSSLANGYSQLHQMMEPPLELTREAALRRLQGSMVGPDGETSCALAFLTEYGATQRGVTIDEIVDTANEVLGIAREDLYIAGTTVDGEAIDALSRESLERFAIPSAIVSFLLCWICLRSLWFTVPVMLIAAFGQSLCLALVYFTGGQMNAVLIVLPTLVFVLSISAGIHLTNYFMEEIRQGERENAVKRAIRRAWSPSVLAAVTTAIGLLSLLVSDVEPVRQFGWLGASGVLASFAILFLVMPGVMYRWQMRYGASVAALPSSRPEAEHTTPFWQAVTRIVAKFHTAIVAVCMIAIVTCAWGVQYLRTSVDVMTMLDDDVRVVRDSKWFQEKIGPLIPVEVIVRFPRENDIDVIDRVKLVSEIHAELSQIEPLGGVVSVATFVPSIPRKSSLRATLGRSVLRTRIEAEMDSLVETGYLRVDAEGEHWRIGARAPGHSEIDYIALLDVLRDRIEPLVDEFKRTENVEIETTYTGATSAVFEVQSALLADLFNSFLSAVLLVGCVMVVAFRGLTAGLLAMIPNVFPTFIMFGALGWLDRAVDIGSVMTASVALGIAVDGTFHYLASYRNELSLGHSTLRAVSLSYQHCGRALVQTTLVCTLGMVIYCFSSFLPAKYFTWTFILLLLIAAAGDLVLLPALLLGPAARLFARSKRE